MAEEKQIVLVRVYDLPGLQRTYYQEQKNKKASLYCFQRGLRDYPDLYLCSLDGEPEALASLPDGAVLQVNTQNYMGFAIYSGLVNGVYSRGSSTREELPLSIRSDMYVPNIDENLLNVQRLALPNIIKDLEDAGNKDQADALTGIQNLLDAWHDSRDDYYYIVVVKMRVGEYETYTHHFVKAPNIKAAGIKALEGESHCDDAEYDIEDEIMRDCGGSMVYFVYSIKQVGKEDLATLKEYGMF